ncbi:DUF3306 domain-containing protein [Halomonas salinarum]|uniref:DUF3306 domain-containing protein n=1 Tax=Halomonas salinarum TaxID=1158993 RepID=UPI00143C0AB3|nr:DUF3306 domain-containing protein [Halomonas salinarum]
MTRFSRWSQRKRGLEPDDQQTPDTSSSLKEDELAVHDIPIEGQTVSSSETDDTTLQVPVDELPDPDTLPPNSNLTAYLGDGVSREIRRRALKRMFAADHYHHRDGLNDYDDDYRQLKNLSQEVADRLRQWTHQHAEKEDSTEQADQHAQESSDAPESQNQDLAETNDANKTTAPDEETSEPPKPGANSSTSV